MMHPEIATVAFASVVVMLFVLDRDRNARTSKALWLPVIWISIAASRAVSAWLDVIGFTNGAPLMGSPDEGSPLDRNVTTALLAMGIIVLFNRRRMVARLLRANGALLLFLLYGAISVLWSDYPDVAFKRWIRTQGSVVMIMIVLTDPDRLVAVKRFLTRPAFVLVPMSILVINYYPNVGRYYDPWVWQPTVSGLTTNKNELGMICMVFGLASLYWFSSTYRERASTQRTRRLIAHAALLAMVFWLFRMANSMTSQSCFLLAGSLIVATNHRLLVRRPRLAHLLVALVMSVALSALFVESFGGVLKTIGRNSTLTGRTEIWDLVLSLSGNPFFGTGFGSFWVGWRLEKIWSVYWFKPVQAHSGYLEMYLNLGLIGLALLAVVIIAGYRNVLAGFRLTPDASRLKLAYLVTVVIYNATEAAFGGLMLTIFLLSVMVVPKTPVSKGPTRPESDHIDWPGGSVDPGVLPAVVPPGYNHEHHQYRLDPDETGQRSPWTSPAIRVESAELKQEYVLETIVI